MLRTKPTAFNAIFNADETLAAARLLRRRLYITSGLNPTLGPLLGFMLSLMLLRCYWGQLGCLQVSRYRSGVFLSRGSGYIVIIVLRRGQVRICCCWRLVF